MTRAVLLPAAVEKEDAPRFATEMADVESLADPRPEVAGGWQEYVADPGAGGGVATGGCVGDGVGAAVVGVEVTGRGVDGTGGAGVGGAAVVVAPGAGVAARVPLAHLHRTLG
jgi:hypothetical protein